MSYLSIFNPRATGLKLLDIADIFSLCDASTHEALKALGDRFLLAGDVLVYNEKIARSGSCNDASLAEVILESPLYPRAWRREIDGRTRLPEDVILHDILGVQAVLDAERVFRILAETARSATANRENAPGYISVIEMALAFEMEADHIKIELIEPYPALRRSYENDARWMLNGEYPQHPPSFNEAMISAYGNLCTESELSRVPARSRY